MHPVVAHYYYQITHLLWDLLSDYKELWIALVSAYFGWVLQKKYQERRDREKTLKDNIINLNKDKSITDDIIWDLRPGNSIELAKHLLGPATKISKEDYSVFLEQSVPTNSYLYVFSNAFVKVVSEDNISIDCITVLPFPQTKFSIEALLREEFASYNLNEMVVTENLIHAEHGLAGKFTTLSTRTENICVVEQYDGYPTYHHHIFYAEFNEMSEYLADKDPIHFIGSVITGISISYSSEKAFYIYEGETR